MLKYCKKKIKNQKDIEWAGFEVEIRELLKKFDSIKNNKEKDITEFIGNKDINVFFENHDSDIGDKFYIERNMVVNLEQDLKNLIRAFEIYIFLFVNKINCEKLKGDISNIDLVLSFNYTNTFERLYDNINEKGYSEIKVVYDYTHGKANEDSNVKNNNMVLGIDEYLDDKVKNRDLDFIFFKKYFQRIYKKTGCEYKNFIKYSKKFKRNINLYFYGHSLSRLDNDVLRDLILQDKSKSTIYYHSMDSYRSQITNLVDIIGQDELIDMINKENIIFENIEKKQKIEIKADFNNSNKKYYEAILKDYKIKEKEIVENLAHYGIEQ